MNLRQVIALGVVVTLLPFGSFAYAGELTSLPAGTTALPEPFPPIGPLQIRSISSVTVTGCIVRDSTHVFLVADQSKEFFQLSDVPETGLPSGKKAKVTGSVLAELTILGRRNEETARLLQRLRAVRNSALRRASEREHGESLAESIGRGASHPSTYVKVLGVDLAGDSGDCAHAEKLVQAVLDRAGASMRAAADALRAAEMRSASTGSAGAGAAAGSAASAGGPSVRGRAILASILIGGAVVAVILVAKR